MALKLGVPSKGRLQDKTFEWFAARGVGMERSDAPRLRFLCRPELMILEVRPAAE